MHFICMSVSLESYGEIFSSIILNGLRHKKYKLMSTMFFDVTGTTKDKKAQDSLKWELW